MVIYFSRDGATKKYASVLAEIKGEEIFEIKQQGSLSGKVFSAIGSVLKQEKAIAEFPEISDNEMVYLCSPVWGGGFPPPMRYFVKHANLSGKTIKLLLTCMTLSNKYVAEYEKQLNEVGAKLSKSILFSSKATPEPPKEELMNF